MFSHSKGSLVNWLLLAAGSCFWFDTSLAAKPEKEFTQLQQLVRIRLVVSVTLTLYQIL